MQDETQDSTSGALAAGLSSDGANTDGQVSGDTAIEVPDHVQDQLPTGTQVVKTDEGALKAIVPGTPADPETESVFHHIVTDVEHTLEALVGKVKAFFSGESAS